MKALDTTMEGNTGSHQRHEIENFLSIEALKLAHMELNVEPFSFSPETQKAFNTTLPKGHLDRH